MTHPAVRPARGERRRLRTRGAIIEAGQLLFATRRMDGVTVDDIVQAASVAKGSFYNHFDDKESLAGAIVELVQGDCEFHIQTALRDIADPAIRMVRALGVMIAYAFAHPDRLQAMLSLSERSTRAGAPLNAGVSHDITQGLAQGRFAGISVETGVLIALGMIHITVTHAMAETLEGGTFELAASMGAAILRALGVANDEAVRLATEAASAAQHLQGVPR